MMQVCRDSQEAWQEVKLVEVTSNTVHASGCLT